MSGALGVDTDDVERWQHAESDEASGRSDPKPLTAVSALAVILAVATVFGAIIVAHALLF
jgi:hypothetical protein